MSIHWTVAAYGAAGALASDLVVVALRWKRGERLPAEFMMVRHWIGVLLLAVLAGFLCSLYWPIPRIAAFQIGLSIELVAERLLKSIPPVVERNGVS